MPSKPRSRLLAFFALLFASLAAFFTIWLVVPPPLYPLWIVSLVGSECSLWPGMLGALGAALGIWLVRRGAPRPGITAIVLGAASACLALIPLLECIPIARQNGVTLSVRRYLFGQDPADNGDGIVPETATYATVDGHPLQLDIYRARPADNTPTGGGPAVITIHGGSWRGGKRSDFAHWDRWFAAHGYTVFDIDYRMSPAPNWRISSGDVRAAIGWVKRNSAIYHVDPDRLAVLGRSAGGQLALIAAYTPGAPASPPSDGTPTDTHVRAVISLYGPTDLVWGYNNSLVPDIIRGPQTLSRYLGGSPTEVPAAYAAASPIEHVAPQTPPTLLFHGSRDSLVGVAHTERLSARLSQAGIPHQAVYFPYATHGFDFDINGWASQIEQPIVLRFLHTYLAKRP